MIIINKILTNMFYFKSIKSIKSIIFLPFPIMTLFLFLRMYLRQLRDIYDLKYHKSSLAQIEDEIVEWKSGSVGPKLQDDISYLLE